MFRELKRDIDKNGCWNCTGRCSTNKGYHTITRNKKRMYVHRYMYEKTYWPIPEGMIVCHKCDNTHCINPEHLYLGTYHTNSVDMAKRHRHPNWNKLTEKEVLEIRMNKTERKEILWKRYNVHWTTIYNIKNKRRRKRLTDRYPLLSTTTK